MQSQRISGTSPIVILTTARHGAGVLQLHFKEGIPMKHCFITLFCLATLAACSHAAIDQVAGLGVFSERKYDFDGAYEIAVTPARLAGGDGTGQAAIFMGARWKDSDPDTVQLELKYSGAVGGIAEAFSSNTEAYLNINLLEIRAENQPLGEYKAGLTDHDSSKYNTVTGSIYTDSTAFVAVPFAVFKQMLSASDCRIRIHTNEGYVDVLFSLESGDYGSILAKRYLKGLLTRINAHLRKPT